MTRAVIAGVGRSAYGRRLPSTPWELALDAATAALADSGLDAAEIDGVCRFTAPFEHVPIPQLVRALGIRELAFFSESPLGGEAMGGAIGHAVAAIETGRARAVLVYRALSQSTAGRFGRADTTQDSSRPVISSRCRRRDTCTRTGSRSTGSWTRSRPSPSRSGSTPTRIRTR